MFLKFFKAKRKNVRPETAAPKVPRKKGDPIKHHLRTHPDGVIPYCMYLVWDGECGIHCGNVKWNCMFYDDGNEIKKLREIYLANQHKKSNNEH